MRDLKRDISIELREVVSTADAQLLGRIDEQWAAVQKMVATMAERGLRYTSGDYLVYLGKGGVVRVHESPKGARRRLEKIAGDGGETPNLPSSSSAEVSELRAYLLKRSSGNSELETVIASADAQLLGRIDAQWASVSILVATMGASGFRYLGGDYYVYLGKGGVVRVHETPKGVRRRLQKIADDSGLKITILDGVLYRDDTISVQTDGRIDVIHIEKNPKTLVFGGDVVAPYAVVTVWNGREIIAKKLFIIPNDEWLQIKKEQGAATRKFPTMMATKTVMKRVLGGVYSLLGVNVSDEDNETISGMIERFSEEVPKEHGESSEPNPVSPDADVADVVSDEQPDEQPSDGYPDADFERNLGAWVEVIKRGRRTIEQLAELVKSSGKGCLTAEQLACIASHCAPADVTEVTE